MPIKKANKQNYDLTKYVFINSELYSTEKKPTAFGFIFTELGVYALISLASYFSIYIATNKFTNVKALDETTVLLTEYFSMENLENSLIGIFIVIGLVSSLNYVITNSKLSIDKFLNRLTHSFIDLIFLMLSTMLGLFLGLREYITSSPLTPELKTTLSVINMGIILLPLALFLYVIIIFFIENNKGKILK